VKYKYLKINFFLWSFYWYKCETTFIKKKKPNKQTNKQTNKNKQKTKRNRPIQELEKIWNQVILKPGIQLSFILLNFVHAHKAHNFIKNVRKCQKISEIENKKSFADFVCIY
jgi:hypothetical protein